MPLAPHRALEQFARMERVVAVGAAVYAGVELSVLPDQEHVLAPDLKGVHGVVGKVGDRADIGEGFSHQQ